MAGVFTVQMALSTLTGRWRLYVVLLGVPASQWPEYDLGPGPNVPSIQRRSRALNALGYVFTDGTEWDWTESSERPDDPASRVSLVASATVREAAR